MTDRKRPSDQRIRRLIHHLRDAGKVPGSEIVNFVADALAFVLGDPISDRRDAESFRQANQLLDLGNGKRPPDDAIRDLIGRLRRDGVMLSAFRADHLAWAIGDAVAAPGFERQIDRAIRSMDALEGDCHAN